MIFFDINTFYNSKGGGIRTYHDAKIDYFLKNDSDSYFLIYPGPKYKIDRVGKNVTLVQVYGKTITKDPEGYRLLLDYLKIYKLIKKIQPDIVEAGDPYLTGLFCLFAPLPKEIVRSAFFHADSIETYLKPFLLSKKIIFAEKISLVIEKLFFNLHKKFDAILVASRSMEKKLYRYGVDRTYYVPFAYDPLMMEVYHNRTVEDRGEGIRLLYAARLDREKSVDTLLKIIPELLENPKVHLSVAGRGQYEEEFAKISHSRFKYLGYISSRVELADIYRNHQIFLATGKYETFGFSILEAMAAGLLVVGPDRGETGERLKECRSSYMYRAEDEKSFLEKIFMACNSNLDLEAQTAHKFAEGFGGWNNAIDRMIQGYKKNISKYAG